MYGYVHFNSWAGRTKRRVKIIAETPKRYKVKFLETYFRYQKDSIHFIPKYAVELIPE